MSGSNPLPVTQSQFYTDFPAFSDEGKYPPPMVLMYLTMAGTSLQARTWGTWLTQGIELWTAHFLTLDAQNDAVAAQGGTPGVNGGVVASKSVGSVSVSYDSADTAEAGRRP